MIDSTLQKAPGTNAQEQRSSPDLQVRYAVGPTETKQFTTEELRANFLVESLFSPDVISLCYSHYDRVMVGGAMPVARAVRLGTYPELRSEYFLERRELGIINVGGPGTVQVDGQSYELNKLDCLYVGRGSRDVTFTSIQSGNPAHLYLLSSPAHQAYPTQKAASTDAFSAPMGSAEGANERVIYRYIHRDGLTSCQLVMGLTILKSGSVWNTMPAHTHDRRSEAYLYFDMPADQRVVHLMGQPTETRHLIVADRQAIISPPWSIHSGCGTSNYSFIWGMAGENKEFTDMDAVPISALR